LIIQEQSANGNQSRHVISANWMLRKGKSSN
jgi:hypothetical protein